MPASGKTETCSRCGLRHRDEADCPVLRVGQTLAGRYTVVRFVGAGGTSTVFKAQNVSIGRFVALKILHKHLRSHAATVERFAREGRAMSRVRHPGVVDVLDLTTTDDGIPMLVLEYVRARTLAAEIRRSGQIALPRAVDLVGQLLAVLAAVHDRGLVHRDIKPTNLLVGVDARRRDVLKLADFGLAAWLDRATEQGDWRRVRMTPPGKVVATPRYLAPELLRGSDGVDPRVDIYGAGLVMFEMLTGRPAFESEHMDDLADAILHGHPPSVATRVRDVPPGIDEIIARALSRHPGERYPSALTMLDALRPFGAIADVVEAEPTDTQALAPRHSLPAAAYVVASPSRRVSSSPAWYARVPGRSSSPARTPAPSSQSVVRLTPRPSPMAGLVPPSLDLDPMSTESAVADRSRVRGAIVATAIAALRKQFGEPPTEVLLAQLPTGFGELARAHIEPDAWLPGGLTSLLIERADVSLGQGDGTMCITFGRHVAHTLLRPTHAELFDQATPESAVIEAGALWKSYFEAGELRTVSVGRGYARLELRDLPAPRRSTCLAVAGFIEAVTEMAGGRDVEVMIPSCRSHGDAMCTFDVNWMG